MSSRACGFCLLALGCSAEGTERAQTLLFIDTNALVLGQSTRDPELPVAVAVDTLRIDRLDSRGEPVETRELVVSEPSDWPVSFGVVSAQRTRFRIRAFRADNAQASEAGPLAPARNLALDRLVELEPATSFERKLVTLDAGCFNAPASFGKPWLSCLDAAALSVPPQSGLTSVVDTPPSQVGTSPWQRTLPCADPPPPGALCIPGGPGVLGDDDAALFALGPGQSPAPAHVIGLAPFFLDRTEMTVARYRELSASGLSNPPASTTNALDDLRRECTLPTRARGNDDLPLNCVSHATAQELCALAGGALPTEAQWEYAARGRGHARRFPWGAERADCCTASLARESSLNQFVECNGAGIEPVGSHDANDCATHDRSRDGVLDLGGSMQEWVSDAYRPYDHACWSERGILNDPLCVDPTVSAHVERGSYFNASLATALSVHRSQGTQGNVVGLRCAYPARSVE
jgi:formylglycine-generating enzyme required for sulfatase activity